MTRSFVMTGGGRGIGRAIAERLTQDGHVVVPDLDGDALDDGGRAVLGPDHEARDATP